MVIFLFINIYAVKIYASGFLRFTPKDTHPSTSNALSITGKPETESESELFTGDTSKDNHSPGRTIIHQEGQSFTRKPARMYIRLIHITGS